MRFSHVTQGKWPFSRKKTHQKKAIFPVAWKKSHPGGRKSGLTNQCAFGPQGIPAPDSRVENLSGDILKESFPPSVGEKSEGTLELLSWSLALPQVNHGLKKMPQMSFSPRRGTAFFVFAFVSFTERLEFNLRRFPLEHLFVKWTGPILGVFRYF